MSLKKQAISGIIWTFAQQFSVQIINFIVQIILARLLMPEDFGLIAMLIVFINLGQMLMDGGMTTSLIRTKNPDQLDYSTVFVTNLLMSISIYVIIFCAAPFVAFFYDQPSLKDILRVFSLTFVIRSFVAVHVAKLTKEMNFKTQMKLQVPSTIIGAFVGVWMAYSGYGVWSLVWLNLTQTIAFTLQNWIFIPWNPSFIFNKRRFKHHFNFGYKMTLSGILDTIYNDAYRIVIGKFYSPSQVGFYNQAETIRLFPVVQLGKVLEKVTYPLFSNINDDIQLKNAYRQTMRLVLFMVVPMMMILIVTGEEFFMILFGEKWLPSVPYFQVLAFASIIKPITTYNLNILKVKGRSDLFLKIEVYKKILGVIAIIIALPFGIMALVTSYTIVYYLMNLINMYYSGKLINYSLKEQLNDCYRIYLIGVICLAITYYIRHCLLKTSMNHLTVISFIAFIFVSLYVFFTYFANRELLHTIKTLFKK